MAQRDAVRTNLHRGHVDLLATDRVASAAEALGHGFARPELLAQALTHPSAKERRGGHDYERLEFLGDRVLALIVTDMLLEAFPKADEGALAKRHAALVRREALARVAAEVGLGDFLVLSKGEEESGGRGSEAILADSVEAVIAALYLDGGLKASAAFVRRHWTRLMEAASEPPEDPKTILQEWAQGASKPLPSYRTVGVEGPPHEPTFSVVVHVEGIEPVTGSGPSKRAAEQAAAAAMLERVRAGKGIGR